MKKIAITTAGVVGAAAAALLLYQIWPTAERPAAAAESASQLRRRRNPIPSPGSCRTPGKRRACRRRGPGENQFALPAQGARGQTVKVAQIKGNGVYFSRTYPSGTKLNYHNTLLTDGKIVTLASTGQLLMVELYSMKRTSVCSLDRRRWKIWRKAIGRVARSMTPCRPNLTPCRPNLPSLFKRFWTTAWVAAKKLKNAKGLRRFTSFIPRAVSPPRRPCGSFTFLAFHPSRQLALGASRKENVRGKAQGFQSTANPFSVFLQFGRQSARGR